MVHDIPDWVLEQCSSRDQVLLALAEAGDYRTVSQIADSVIVSENTVRRKLRELEKETFAIEREDMGTGVLWKVCDPVEAKLKLNPELNAEWVAHQNPDLRGPITSA